MDTFKKPLLADINSNIEWAGFQVALGTTHRCLGGAIINPSEFYLNLKVSWNPLENAQKELDDYFEETSLHHVNDGKSLIARKDDHYYYPNPETLLPGLYIAVLTKIQGKLEWYRGQILQHLVNKKYKVMLIDYGDKYNNFTIEDIRYIPQKFLKFPAQAIRCKLDFGTHLNELHLRESFWKVEEAKKFLNILEDADLSVEFRSFAVDMSLTNPILWLVKMKTYDQNGTINSERVDHGLLCALGKNWVKRQEKQIELNQQSTCIRDAPTSHFDSNALHCVHYTETFYDIEFLRLVDGDEEDSINVAMTDFNGILIPKHIFQ
ncbi:unnamed protein product [Orchesella dallaii]|uniref:Tudor domain-containing protein n=1 Tax=Orchesella dallaii TaxID=48710 RepID=A0ABP1RKJ2_9HEXA